MSTRKTGATGGDGRRKRDVVPRGADRAIAPVNDAGRDLAPSAAAAQLPAVIRDGGATLVQNTVYSAGGRLIADASVYRVDGMKGAQLGEADKIAWLDPATGYECIILRSAQGGHLGGYVGVPPEHPLYGFPPEAIPAELGIEVHGGIRYAAACLEGPESTRAATRRCCRRPWLGIWRAVRATIPMGSAASACARS